MFRIWSLGFGDSGLGVGIKGDDDATHRTILSLCGQPMQKPRVPERGTTFQNPEEMTQTVDHSRRKARTTTSQKCKLVAKRARIQGSSTCVPLNSRLESHDDEEKQSALPGRHPNAPWPGTLFLSDVVLQRLI